MPQRPWVRGRGLRGLSAAVQTLNARHPWSHNDSFHGWILTRLPDGRRRALDVGCGQGALLAALAPAFDRVRGLDADDRMRREAAARCSGLPGVSVGDEALADTAGEVDLITMVAVLHHLDAATALRDVRRLLAPGGRFLCVGLARPHSPRDHAWDLASAAANPVVGWVRHPWVSRGGVPVPPYPVRDPTLTYDEVRALVDVVLPGARMRHRLAFRHTIEWTKPA